MATQVPPEDLDFIRTFEEMIVVGGYAFVHAGIAARSGARSSSRARTCAGSASRSCHTTRPHSHVIVHGHTIYDRAVIRAQPHRDRYRRLRQRALDHARAGRHRAQAHRDQGPARRRAASRDSREDGRSMKIAMVGSGYVGLVSGACLADFGHDVVCIDKDPAKIDLLLERRDADLRAGPGRTGRRATSRPGGLPSRPTLPRAIDGAAAIFIAVGTPSRRGDGHADLTFVVRSRARDRRATSRPPATIVTKSTVPVGTGDEVERIIRDAGAPACEFAVVSNPEFLREGAAISDFKRPDRIVIGAEDEFGAAGDARGLSPAVPQQARRSCSPAAARPS